MHVIAAVRQLNRTETVGEGLRVALEEIAAVSPGFIVPLLDADWHERYGHRFETARLLGRGSSKTSIATLAGRVGADGAALLARIDADRAAGWINLLPSVQVLRVLWEEQFTTSPGGALVLKDAADVAPSAERLHSVHDPEARYSTKGRGGDDDLEWIGTKCHLTESADDDLPHLITDVHTTAATDPDVTATTPIQDKLAGRGLAPAQHLMDAGYPSAATIAASAAAGIARQRQGRHVHRQRLHRGLGHRAGHLPGRRSEPFHAPGCPGPGHLPVPGPGLPPVSAASRVHQGRQSRPGPLDHRPSRAGPHRQNEQ